MEECIQDCHMMKVPAQLGELTGESPHACIIKLLLHGEILFINLVYTTINNN